MAGIHVTYKADTLAVKLGRKLSTAWKDLWTQLNRENLHFRIIRCAIATAVTVIIALLPGIKAIYGPMAYLGPLTTVFVLGHPGRRLGGMIEALVLGLIGISVGTGWATLGTYLGSMYYKSNPSVTMGIRAIFLTIAMLVHGYIRSATPRLFVMVLLMAVPVVIGVTSTSFYISGTFVTKLLYPMMTAIAILLIVNILIFPEFGATGLGLTTVETLQRTITILNGATDFFVESFGNLPFAPGTGHPHHPGEHILDKKVIRLAELTASRSTLRAKVAECKSVYRDCAFDISYSCLAPKELKPIAGKGMSKLVMNVMALIGACESKYALMGTAELWEERGGDDVSPGKVEKEGGGKAKVGKEKEKEMGGSKERDKEKEEKKEATVSGLKVKRAIEGGDQQLLKYLLRRITVPVNTLQRNIDRSIDVISTCVAIVYDVPRLPSLKQGGAVRHPAGVLLQELDTYIDCLSEAITLFAETSTQALEGAADLQALNEKSVTEVDIMPRDEIFLISSFILNLRMAASQALEMLKHSRVLVEARQERKGKRGLHWPDVRLGKWLSTGSEETEAIFFSESLHSHKREDKEDEERDSRLSRGKTAAKKLEKDNMSWHLKARGVLADFIDWVKNSDDVIYTFKFTFGVMLVSWPAFVHEWTLWYENSRAVWVAIIFILMFENAVGSTIWMIFLRAAGTVLGSTLGYAAYESGHGNTITMGTIMLILLIPAYYIQLGTKYQKAGMIFTVSMSVVGISTHLQTVPGTSFENFYKRASASLISGAVALLVHVTIFPVKARTKLKFCLATAISKINLMESCVALGVDGKHIHMLQHPRFLKRFEKAAKKAGAALSAAEAFLEHARHEPRLKGRWEPHRMVYKEIIFVLRQIVERMENLLRLRISFGSAVLEEFNARVHGYRRNVAAAITLTLYAVEQSLTQKLPLPQFLPSARLANLRMVVRVRQILHEESQSAATTPRRSRSGSVKDQYLVDGKDEDEITFIPPAPTCGAPSGGPSPERSPSTCGQITHRRRTLRLKFLSWNAASAALEECVEYVEELVDLVKLLVGVNEFRSGLLHRPTFREYLADIHPLTHGEAGSRMGGTMEGIAGAGAGDKGGGIAKGKNQGEAIVASTLGGTTVSFHLDRLDSKIMESEDMGIFTSGGVTLPHPLARIQCRREAVRLKRKKE
ncbi:hypothetical protein BGX38DRAFT_1219730 [Terfezia claveryi]|nr:hypothetical protein BGX38DRAFT_1219730 [Terfezia claveryi]